MNKTLPIALLAILALLTTRAAAQEHRERRGDAARQNAARENAAFHSEPAGTHGNAERHEIGPVPPDVGRVWPGTMLMVIALLFAGAIAVGITAGLHAPPAEMPPTHSHDEPPGASHHHGASGTINPEPDHGHH